MEGCDKRILEWLVYVYFYYGEYDKVLVLYKELFSVFDVDFNYYIYLFVCFFYLVNYDEVK